MQIDKKKHQNKEIIPYDSVTATSRESKETSCLWGSYLKWTQAQDPRILSVHLLEGKS